MEYEDLPKISSVTVSVCGLRILRRRRGKGMVPAFDRYGKCGQEAWRSGRASSFSSLLG